MFLLNNILDVYEIPFINIPKFIFEYYAECHKILNDKNYKIVKNIFNTTEDKKIFDLIFKRRLNILTDADIQKYYNKKYYSSSCQSRIIKEQYLDKINKSKVQYFLDLGFNSGFNAIAYNRLLPNLKKIYAFEVIYDVCKKSYIECFLEHNKIELIQKAVGENVSKAKFYININNPNASMADFSISAKREQLINQNIHKEIDVDVTSIDVYCRENNIQPDFIKMDIEGSELPALKGGIYTIKKFRPQLAISIYHSDKDFIEIPLYLKNNLENYEFKIGHYAPDIYETVLYAIPCF